MNDPVQSYPHYYKSVEGFDFIDVYRVIDLWEITSPPLQHALKKIMAAGTRGNKNMERDIEEAIVSLQRWQQMRSEDAKLEKKTELDERVVRRGNLDFDSLFGSEGTTPDFPNVNHPAL